MVSPMRARAEEGHYGLGAVGVSALGMLQPLFPWGTLTWTWEQSLFRSLSVSVKKWTTLPLIGLTGLTI